MRTGTGAMCGAIASARTGREAASRRLSSFLLVAVVYVAACATLHPAGPQLDINASDARQLSMLPGLTPDDAARIVANRPYYELRDLVRNHVLDESQYTRIKEKVYVGPPGMPEYLRGVPPGTN